jgi:molybdopterin-guanine dinucleotide biosynthesis protein A
MIDPQQITALILAGGRGSRMGGADKGLQNFNGLPLALHTLTRLQMTGLERCETPFMVTVPCDTPLLPLDLVARLAQALLAQDADIAMVSAPEVNSQGQRQLFSQPVFCLLRVSLLQSLQNFTQAGGRKIGAWTALHKTVLVPFDLPTDDARAFCNANSLSELRQLENAPS